MHGEHQITLPVLEALDESMLGELTTTDLRGEVRARLKLSAQDLKPLKNRNDQCIDQIVRNIKSHKKAADNLISRGLVEDIPRGIRITKKGRAYLRNAGHQTRPGVGELTPGADRAAGNKPSGT